MNKNVLKVMLILVMIFLLGLYILKVCLPEEFLLVINNPQLIAIGNYIDNSWWLSILIPSITSFIVYWLYLCAVNKKWRLNWIELVSVIVVIIITQLLYLWNYNLASGVNVVAMLLLPLIGKAQFKDVVIVYCVHYFAQLLSLEIRSLPLLLECINSITALVLTFECYLWLVLFYLFYNYKKESTTMGKWAPPLYGDNKRRKIERNILKIDNKIAKLKADKKVYEEMLAETTKNSA